VTVNAVAASKAKTRPRGQADAAKIRKFIAENPFSTVAFETATKAPKPARLGGCLFAK
jgi:hypothetical protein